MKNIFHGTQNAIQLKDDPENSALWWLINNRSSKLWAHSVFNTSSEVIHIVECFLQNEANIIQLSNVTGVNGLMLPNDSDQESEYMFLDDQILSTWQRTHEDAYFWWEFCLNNDGSVIIASQFTAQKRFRWWHLHQFFWTATFKVTGLRSWSNYRKYVDVIRKKNNQLRATLLLVQKLSNKQFHVSNVSSDLQYAVVLLSLSKVKWVNWLRTNMLLSNDTSTVNTHTNATAWGNHKHLSATQDDRQMHMFKLWLASTIQLFSAYIV